MHEARRNVWRLMRARRRQVTLARIAQHWACYDLASEHAQLAADLLHAAREAQRLVPGGPRVRVTMGTRLDWLVFALVALVVACALVSNPPG